MPGSTKEIQECTNRYLNETQKIKSNGESEWKVRKIGKLSLEDRFAKIQKYWAKKDKRQFDRKITYDCRKTVADSRMRIKGKFVKKED